MARPSLEVADIFRKFGLAYHQQYGRVTSYEQLRVIRAVEICRTSVLGGHVDQCNHCGHKLISYNSCRNRHCPKCQTLAKEEWLQARQKELLPVGYFHIVFTLPGSLNSPTLQNRRVIYNLLFRAASQALLSIAADPKHLGAEIGFTAILHTWGQRLHFHPHLHCVVPGGGLSKDGKKWIPSRKKFFLPVRVLSRRFRTLFLEGLKQCYRKRELEFGGKAHPLSNARAFDRFLKELRREEWVVYCKPPFGGPKKVLDYLARYTHRIAISNHRLVGMDDKTVSFLWRDYRKGNQRGVLTLEGTEFIRRFLLHVLPRGFTRIRHYGFLANRYRKEKLRRCRALLDVAPTAESDTSCEGEDKVDWKTRYEQLVGKPVDLCPRCREGRLITLEVFPGHRFHSGRAPP